MSEDPLPTRIVVLAAANGLASAGLLWMGLIIVTAGSGSDAWLPLEQNGVPSGFIPSFMPLLLLGSAASTRVGPALRPGALRDCDDPVWRRKHFFDPDEERRGIGFASASGRGGVFHLVSDP